MYVCIYVCVHVCFRGSHMSHIVHMKVRGELMGIVPIIYNVVCARSWSQVIRLGAKGSTLTTEPSHHSSSHFSSTLVMCLSVLNLFIYFVGLKLNFSYIYLIPLFSFWTFVGRDSVHMCGCGIKMHLCVCVCTTYTDQKLKSPAFFYYSTPYFWDIEPLTKPTACHFC